jgi:hypothetical protein
MPVRTFAAQRFTLIEDPGHGWLEMPRSLIAELGLMDRITGYSYQNADKVYLEEYCDLPAFLCAFRTRYGMRPLIDARPCADWVGRRRYASFTPDPQ